MQVFIMTLIMVLFFGVLVCALPHLVFGIWWAVSSLFHLPAPSYAPFGWTALALVLAAWLVMAYGFFWGRFRLWVNHTDYTSSDIPAAFDGYKVVHISDLHLSTFNDRPAALQRVVDSINALQPDLICFTGDLVTEGVAEAQPYADVLRSLRATDGVVSVLGNHDLLIYSLFPEEQRLAEVERLAAFERDSLGWQLLRNRHITLTRESKDTYETQTLTVVGVDNTSCDGQGFRTIYSGDLPKALQGTDGFRLLLSHDPSQWMAEIVDKTPISLTLSGHTHAGQMRIFGHALSDLMFRESAGWYHHLAQSEHSTTQSLYVNEGIGCTAPVRINCPSEITLITLHHISPSDL